MIQMEREDQDRAIQMADAYGSGTGYITESPMYERLESMPEFIKEEGF